MAEPDRALGGYDPDAGLAAHQVDRPTLIPVPSLLRSLLSDHLDPGYAAAAENKAAGNRRTWRQAWCWQITGALVIAVVFAAAVAQARSVAPGVKETQHVLANSVRESQNGTDALAAQRARLAAEVDAVRRSQLADDALGQQLLRGLDALAFASASTPVTGPGLTVRLTDPGVAGNLTDVSKERIPGSRQVVLDRDLQLVVNSLWASGAEAISVGGVRVGPNVTIRQAGGAVLVDNQPIASPYAIVAIGPPHGMQDAFERSPGLQRAQLLETSYGVGVSVTPGDGLTVPATSTRDVKFAKEIHS
ncbi:MAG: DUF881 domain-containing protein [Mycobacteriaceae bacterium]|nr:DUF881 domain-containing protein [Mycobacteriaceae bacterium]